MTRHLVVLLPALLLAGCHPSGFGCSVERALTAAHRPDAGSARDSLGQNVDLLDRLESRLLGVRYFESELRVGLVVKNVGDVPLEIKGGSVSYANDRASVNAAFAPDAPMPDCATNGDAPCTFDDVDGAVAIRLPPGGQAIPDAAPGVDAMPDGAHLLQTVSVLVRRAGEERWREYRDETPVVVVERRINCVTGLGHGYRRIDS